MDRTKIATLLVILAVIVGVLVISFDRQQNKNVASNKPAASASDTLTNLAKQMEVQPQLRDSMYVDWIDDNNNVVPLIGKQFTIGTVNIKGIEKYKGISDIEMITFASLQPIEQVSNTFFTSNGFVSNKQNVKTYRLEAAPYKTWGFENDELKCLVRVDEHTDPFGNFFCGTVDTSQIDLQKQMGTMLPYKVTKEGISSLRVEKIENDYAKGTYSEAFTGYTWMAKKEGNSSRGETESWKVLWKSNDIAPCVDMERLGIPKSVYGDCYTPEGLI